MRYLVEAEKSFDQTLVQVAKEVEKKTIPMVDEAKPHLPRNPVGQEAVCKSIQANES